MRPEDAPRCRPDDPFVAFYRIGGKPWHKNGELRRIYFSPSPRLRGQDAWEQANPGRSMPAGYFDVHARQWVSQHPGWTHTDYGELMAAAIKRRTFAAFVPERDVFTRDGVKMVPGMIVMFHGGKIPNRPHWGMDNLVNRLMIAGHRVANWHFGEHGKIVRYGNMNVPTREYSPHREPYAWLVYPMREDEPFVIEGRNVDVKWSFLYVDPPLSLVSVDGGKRFADEIPAEPAPKELEGLLQ